jgi:hypothetical protein
MIKELENVKIGGIEYNYISIDTENTAVEKTYVIKNKHKYDWQTTGKNEFGVWDSFLNQQNGKEYIIRVYKKDIFTFLKGDVK